MTSADFDFSEVVRQTAEADTAVDNAISQSLTGLESVSSTISNLHSETLSTDNEINNLKNSLETRNRMLQLTVEKNIYKRKVILTLLAVILLLVILMGASYFYLR